MGARGIRFFRAHSLISVPFVIHSFSFVRTIKAKYGHLQLRVSSFASSSVQQRLTNISQTQTPGKFTGPDWLQSAVSCSTAKVDCYECGHSQKKEWFSGWKNIIKGACCSIAKRTSLTTTLSWTSVFSRQCAHLTPSLGLGCFCFSRILGAHPQEQNPEYCSRILL